MRSRRLFIMTSIAVIASTAGLWAWQSKHNHLDLNPLNTNNSIANDEDFFADHIHVTKYNADGSLYYKMQSTHITHNENNDIALVTQPIMKLYAAQNVQWNVTAERGKVYNHQQAIDLIDNVAISKYESNNNTPALRLTTQLITLHPEDNTFATDEHVNIKTDTTHTTATGMKASMENNRIQLLHNVRTRYEK